MRLLFSLALLLSNLIAQDFYAYYTRLDYQDQVSGKYADIVISYGELGRFVFSRESSYLPSWETANQKRYVEEIIPRTGIDESEHPDMHLLYSHARIIKDTPQEIVIHWRYMPDLNHVNWDGVVDEYFTLTPDLKVIRTIRQGTTKLDDWHNPANVIRQELRLARDGIIEICRVREAAVEPERPSIKGSHVRENTIADPGIEFTFDGGMSDAGRDKVIERISGEEFEISGHKTLWKTGVSGTALMFDGYYSAIGLPPERTPSGKSALTVEGWVALGAYPFQWAPIVHQSRWGKEGYYLGINEDGFVGIHIASNDQWHSTVYETRLELFRWYHIVAVVDGNQGTLQLYVDGKETASKPIPVGEIEFANEMLHIGMNSQKMPAIEGRIRIGKWPSMFGIDGLLDEIRIHDKALSPKEITSSFKSYQLPEDRRDNPDMEEREIPVNPNNQAAERFGAYYTRLKYYETWDNMWRVGDHPDVIVDFDLLPTKLVMWRGMSYGLTLVTENGKWAGDQSSENYRELDDPSIAEGCCEHMSDKQCRHSHVRIIENTDARVVVHWRYGLVDSRYLFVKSGHEDGDWADEYWTIYPDGVAVRHLARGMIWGDSWVETMFFSEPGTRPEDNIELEAYTLVNAKGASKTYSWADGSPECDLPDPIISMINMKSEYRPFNIYPRGSEVATFHGHNEKSHFHWWNHWPVSQIVSDGRGARAADRAAHSSLVWGIPDGDYLMYGFTNEPAESLLPLARSWNSPPPIRKTRGCTSRGFIPEERAYSLIAESVAFSFILNGPHKKPIVNPCFVIKNWDSAHTAELKINGVPAQPGVESRQGIIRDTDGSRTLVLWLRVESDKPLEIEVAVSS